MLPAVSKAAARRLALQQWWDRRPLPCILLSVDPGATSGATLLDSGPGGIRLEECREVRLDSRDVESSIKNAINLHFDTGRPLVFAFETWGAGGMRGIDQWLGLGEARGVWRREARAQCALKGVVHREVLINMTRWRSRVIESAGGHDETGKFQRFTPDEWKEAALKKAEDFFMDAVIPPYDAAESACMGIYAIRSDEVLKKLPTRVLDLYAVSDRDRQLLEPTIAGTKPKKSKRKRKSDDANTSGSEE